MEILADYSKIYKWMKDHDYIICADGGVKHSNAMNIIPNLIVGDLDSATPTLLEKYNELGVTVERFPTEKDVTDTQIAVDLAMSMGADEILLIGALGDRWDHSYANVMLLYRMAKRGITGWIIGDKNIITICNSILRLEGEKDQLLSLLPFGGNVHIQSTFGLKYPISDEILTKDYPLGISNVFADENVEVIIKKAGF